jgi:EAL domain-containing protein (putative c-di-GMP-specific phosphodiesterase class I)
MIKHLPLDTLKIDRSFVQDLNSDASDVAIVRAITALGQGLGLRVLAEGVETESQLEILKQLHCHSAQGYLLSPPIPAAQMTHVLKCIQQQTLGLSGK